MRLSGLDLLPPNITKVADHVLTRIGLTIKSSDGSARKPPYAKHLLEHLSQRHSSPISVPLELQIPQPKITHQLWHFKPSFTQEALPFAKPP